MKRANYIILILFLGWSLSTCSKKSDVATAPPQDENSVSISDSSLQLMDVRLEAPAIKLLQSFIYLNGKVVSMPNFTASVTSDIEGKISNIFVKEGGLVKKGDQLMSIRSMPLIELQGEYMEAKSQADFMTIEYQRQQELRMSNIGALAEYQITESRYKQAKSKVTMLAAKLKLLGIDPASLENSTSGNMQTQVIIRTPIDGYVYKLHVGVGAVATTNSVLAEIINTHELMADVFIYETDLDNISEGQVVEIDFINHLFPSVPGKVIHISRAFDPETKAVTAHVAFEAPPGNLVLPDMSIRCVLPQRDNQQPGPTVPKAAILVEEDHDFVYITYPTEKKEGTNLLFKERISQVTGNEKEVQIRFHNPPNPGYVVVISNVMIVENQRKKMNGMATME